jgi:hypothetical protein
VAAKEKAAEATHKYDVSTLAKDLDLTPQSVRIKLRDKAVKKAKDGVYGWDDRTGYDKVLASLKSEKKPAKAKATKAAKTKEAA